MNRQSYFLEQLCTIGTAGIYAVALGAMFLTTAVWPDAKGQRTVLGMIAPWIQWLVFGGAAVLLVLMIIRAVTALLAQAREHGYDHHHDHAHGHDHGQDHDWLPWRYTVLLLPIMLVVLPFDWDEIIQSVEKKRSKITGGAFAVAATHGESLAVAGAVLAANPLGPSPMHGVIYFAAAEWMDRLEEESTDPPDARPELPTLEMAASSPELRQHWRQFRRVEIQGQFQPETPDGKFFQVMRLRRACCLNDARGVVMLAASRKEVKIPEGEWITATGRIDFAQVSGRWRPVMRVFQVKETNPPRNRYLNY